MIQMTEMCKGILGFPVAPLTTNNELDEDALFKNIEYLIDEKLDAIFIACGSGEYHALSTDEYRRMVEVAMSATKGAVPVYTGVGGNISQAKTCARISEELGASGYLVLPPYLIEGNQEGLQQYIQELLECTDLNAIVYQRANAVLQKHTLEALLDYPHLVGVKDGIGNMDLNIELTQSFGDRLGWLNGMPMAEVTMPAYIPLGFDTYSSAISNYIPHISRMFYNALLEGDDAKVRELYRDVILPINTIRKKKPGYAVSLIKAGMEIIGLPVQGKVRPPITPVAPEHYRELEAIITHVHDKYPKINA
ncbi:5-dehydro-4-deoxyglucarate dehydratase [Geomicrobium sp. JCM 19055]|uniref:5-dehydro-4-deoxyglucarate dehydratase n=1 Tax=Geomicrobium sp. JCM 19055 TaxID=1460649 RepID=UPI0005AAD76E|nr:5-dehydro-4-deoxyglucarate dehydratase [Geomicrobium sp. JCM 19055]